MKKMIVAAVVLLVVQIGLSFALNMSSKGIDTAAPDTRFLTFSPDKVQSIAIKDHDGKNIVLTREKDGWIVSDHFSAPVDRTKVEGLLTKLAGLKQGFVVATSTDAARRFQVDPEGFVSHVILKGADKSLADFYVGTAPIFRQVHARRADSKNIVTVALSSYELGTGVDKWLDTSVATIKDKDLVGLTAGDIKLTKAADGWHLEGLQDGQKINKKAVESLVTDVRGLAVQDVLDPAQAAALFGQPAFQFTAMIKGGDAVKYQFAKGKGDFYVLQMSNRKQYFKVLAPPVEKLEKVTRENLLATLTPAGQITSPPEKK